MYVWYLGVPNKVFPGARTIVPVAIAKSPPPDVPGSFVFAKEYDDWYADQLLHGAVTDERTIREGLDRLWRAQKRLSALLVDPVGLR